jgi:hypothetical protein
MTIQIKTLISTVLFTATFSTALIMPAFAADEAAASAVTSTASAETTTSATTTMEILREKVRADKKLVVANNMNLTDKEAKVFWPIYDAYQKDLQNINKRMATLIDAYALAYNKGAVLNDTAKKLLDDSIAIEISESKLKQTYADKLSKVIPAAKAARYIQIENKIRAIVRYELADAIPLVE